MVSVMICWMPSMTVPVIVFTGAAVAYSKGAAAEGRSWYSHSNACLARCNHGDCAFLTLPISHHMTRTGCSRAQSEDVDDISSADNLWNDKVIQISSSAAASATVSRLLY
ncbi:uncharacterized protein F5891DRAFT_1018219 [Suillus fuscotomentosus]|uniref:Secreted protein n=1 Tax=Suillus fuscotomentosus TaxID=1912939 RepID=A0AAD4EE50_9AGAM|nr:uncharacterized protein F5891DRAFT_1018219 [Suillus fuscotomentosus]KAG1903258.1 hypothetical protein F5891DRAFT_1018219 [Suillus fuscotomentosus]